MRHNVEMEKSGIVALLVLVAVAGGCRATSDPDTDPPVRSLEYRVSVEGWVIAAADEPAMVCGVFLTSYPPQCGLGFEVRGLDLATLPTAESDQGVVWTNELVRVVGTLDTAEFILTATEPAALREPRTGLSKEPPCDEPTGGWPPHRITNDDVDLIRGYGEDNPDTWSGAWTDPGRAVWTVAFTDELSAHEAALGDLYDGPVCVTGAEYTRSELETTREEILALSVEPTEHGPAVRDARVIEAANHVWVQLWLDDAVARAPLDAFAEDAVKVIGWVQVLGTE